MVDSCVPQKPSLKILFSHESFEREIISVNHWDRALLVDQWQRTSLPIQETWVWSLAWEDSLEKEMETHSSVLAWEISWTEEPGKLQSMGLQRAAHDWLQHAAAGIWVCCFFKTHSSKPVTLNSFRDTSHNWLVPLSQSLGFSTIESLLWVLEIAAGQSPPPQRVWTPILGCPFSSELLIFYNSNLNLFFPPG